MSTCVHKNCPEICTYVQLWSVSGIRVIIEVLYVCRNVLSGFFIYESNDFATFTSNFDILKTIIFTLH